MARGFLTPFRGGLTESSYADPFLSLHREMNRLFDDVFRGSSLPTSGEHGNWMQPRIDVSETDKEVRICAELPGVSEKDIDVSLDDDVLTIRGEKKSERKEDKENYHVSERSYGTFQRAMRLPFAVNPDEVRADFSNGALTVTMPRGKEQERSRRIQVSAGGQKAIEQPAKHKAAA
jgi:HSP20 family protein